MFLFLRRNLPSSRLKLRIAGSIWCRSCHGDANPAESYDVVVIGAGHNGLVAANYLQRYGCKVCVLERRHIVGGAAVTEEIIPGFKFSRASYLLSLLRPHIIKDLELKKHGLKIHLRDPSSYTPIHPSMWTEGGPKSLLLGSDPEKNKSEIAKFSKSDSDRYEEYEKMITRFVESMDHLLDVAPPSTDASSARLQGFHLIKSLWPLFKMGRKLGKDIPNFYELCTAPVAKIMDKWFESDVLKATISTDTLIGTMSSCYTPGTGYVLLHHVMGELENIKGAWGYPEGGMGAVSEALAGAAKEAGVKIFTNKAVSSISLNGNETGVDGVITENGMEIKTKVVLSNATPNESYLKFLPRSCLPEDLLRAVKCIDYSSPVTKINVALKELPNFISDPNSRKGHPEGHHQCTIHLNCENMKMLNDAYQDCIQGIPSRRPMIEMVIPSSKDSTLAPPGCHVCLLFTQFTPYELKGGLEWDQSSKDYYAKSVFNQIEEYAPGFKASIVGYEVLPPPELEKIFGLTGGNIFHGAMSLDQLFMMRPTQVAGYKTPIFGYYLCGSGTHPGGGVMGAPGYNAAAVVIKDFKNNIIK